MKIEIQGRDAVKATEELLRIEGLQGSYETINEVERRNRSYHRHHCRYCRGNSDHCRETLPMESKIPEVFTKPSWSKNREGFNCRS